MIKASLSHWPSYTQDEVDAVSAFFYLTKLTIGQVKKGVILNVNLRFG